MTNLHSVTDEPVWERRILWDRLSPNMGLSDADRALLGPLLSEIRTYSTEPSEIVFHLYECAKRMSHAVGMDRLKGLCALDRAYEILIDAGFSSFQPARRQMQVGLKRFTLTALKSLTRSMLATNDDGEAEEISQFLIEVIARGQWTQAEFSAECEAWAAELQARRAC
jgi:hypothetical protein